ncbi:MAG TPA: alpha/beta hydrolase, partial [Capillimicrobium sp.]|nr:alpha/beta hydrolase [Capillimicrobium sp.]
PADDPAYGLGDYARLVVEAIGDRTGGPVVLVAQSMGAFVAPLVAQRTPVARIDLVCPMIPAAGESAAEWWAATGQTDAYAAYAEELGRQADAPFDLRWGFFHDVPPEVVERIMAAGERHQSDTPFEEPWPLDAWPDVPTRVLAGRLDRLFPLPFLRRLARERLGIEPDVIDTGHLPALARPQELAAWIVASPTPAPAPAQRGQASA